MSFRFEEETVHPFLLENLLNMTVDAQLSISLEGFFLRYDYTYLPVYLSLIFVGLALGAISEAALANEISLFGKRDP